MFRIAICFLLIMIVFFTPSPAQFNKGMKMAGASIGSAFFNSGEYSYSYPAPTNGYTSNTNSLGFNLSPNMGWFVSEKTALGVRLLFGYKYDKLLNSDLNNVTYYKNVNEDFSISLGGFARNYFTSSGSFLPFGQASFNAGIGTFKTEGYNYNNSPLSKEVFKGKSSEDFLADAGLSFGVTKMLNPHTGLDIYAGYTFSYSKTIFRTNTSTDINIDGTIDATGILDQTRKVTTHNFILGAGLQIFLAGKR